MTKSKTNIRVFFSWQSDLPKDINLKLIRNALAAACKELMRTKPKLNIVLDEATKNTTGSPNIVQKILEKIADSDIFIADITTITGSTIGRPCPNPNVSYELGYAVANLGWDRVILMFNTKFGKFPKDLPFDFAQHRAFDFDSDKIVKEQLKAFFVRALNAIIEKSPKRPSELKGKSKEKIEHERDVENMEWLLSTLHIPTLDDLIERLPHIIPNKALYFFEMFNGVATNSLFDLYDPVLKKEVEKLNINWREAISHDYEYHQNPGNTAHIFGSVGDMPLNKDRQKNWDSIEEARIQMRMSLATILERVRKNYLEINIKKTNKRAWKDYIEFHKEVDKPPINIGKNKARKTSKA